MTTEPRSRRLLISFALGLALLLGACASESFGRRGGLTEAQVSALPEAVQDSYDVFAYKCSRCHTLARPLNAQITKVEHWEAYVARMRRHAGSAISAEDAETILVFLRYYTEQKVKAAGEERGEGGARP